MRRVRSASRRVRKTGAVPVLGLTRAKSSGVRVKARSGSVMASVSDRKKPQRVSGKGALGAADDEGTELEAGVDVGEEGRQVGTQTAVLEVVDAGDAAGGGDGLEEAGGGAVGVDAGGGEEADEAVGLDEPEGAFDEEGVEVDVATAEQGVVAGGANDLAETVGAGLGPVKGVRPVGRAAGAGA